MVKHTRFSRFVTRVKERKEARQQQRFEFEKRRLEREGQIEIGRAEIRKQQAVQRPKGQGRGGFFGFVDEVIATQRPRSRSVITRSPPRVAAKGRTLFDAQGRPVSVRNAPSIRRAKKKRKRIGASQPQNPFAPTFRI